MGADLDPISRFEPQKMMAEVNTNGEIIVNGTVTTIFNPETPLPGMNHALLFRYQPPNSVPRVIKLLQRMKGDISLPDFRKEVLVAYLGQKSGAPRLFGYGQIEYQGKSYYYVDLELKFPNERKLELKQALLDENQKNLFSQMLEQPEIINRLAQQFAKRYLQVFIIGLIPIDPDIMISESAKVSFIDTGDWVLARNWDSQNIDLFLGELEILSRYIKGVLPSNLSSALNARISNRFIELAGESNEIEDAHRDILLEAIYKNKS